MSFALRDPFNLFYYFQDNEFDLVYAQGSISNFRRKKIIKEIKRISKSEGHLCIGEIVKLSAEIPRYVKDIFDNSELDPLEKDGLSQYYTDRDLTLIDTMDLSSTLREYYEKNLDLLKKNMPQLDKSERSYYKNRLNRISHETNAYLKLGADKYIGFISILSKKNHR
jgi:ubiquinone/menaquinone biosynthesis C-methylase UbiE